MLVTNDVRKMQGNANGSMLLTDIAERSFAPTDEPQRYNWRGLYDLAQVLRAPSGFLGERLQAVACSFGARPWENGEHSTSGLC